ncbi:hypothetical protein LI063_03480 [Clostridium perfringens]|uniref:hypothetical protein n=1 Tax=Clostridium perfringens TaxID=1502 RepID=UPI0022472662|nr:hypothetical protein [Clostridium perfringens]MCX0363225.1 hypothetical protein [Clostridium perfringens]
MIKKVLVKAKTIYCKHEYEERKKRLPFYAFNGIEIKRICKNAEKLRKGILNNFNANKYI